MLPCLVGAVFPDLDMIRFRWDGGHLHHHACFTHIPAFWAAASPILIPRPALWPFFAGVWLHQVLDTLAGDILWAWPLSDRFFHLVEIPAAHDNWMISFALHWTFLVELGITGAAAFVFLRQRTS